MPKKYILCVMLVFSAFIISVVQADDVVVTLDGTTTSSGFVIRNSNSVVTARFTGTGTVGIGTTTPATLLAVGTTTDILNVTVEGRVGVGTTTPSTALHVIGTITATTGYVGDGSQLTGVSATSVGANAVDSSQLVNTLNITDTTMNVGSLTVSAGNFRVDSAGSMTATTITSTGSVTASSMTATTITSTGSITTTGGLFVVDTAGSLTAKTITSTGSITVANNGTITSGFLSVGTITAETAIHGTTTVGFLGGAKFGNTVHFNETNNGDSGAAKTIDWRASNKQRLTITTNTTLTFTNPGGPSNLLIVLVQGDPGTGTVKWPASVKWPGGTAVTVSTATSSVDIVSCYFDGTNYNCVGSLDFR